MSLTLNMVGGGSGGLKATDALLRVQAPAGSTVTITKGTATKTDLGHENADDNSIYDYYFIIHASQFDSVNPWTVTATLNDETSNSTIVIDAADEYDVVLWYPYWILKNGLFVERTFERYGGNSSATAETGSMVYAMTDGNWSTYWTDSTLDVSIYSTMVVVLTGAMFRYYERFGLRTSRTSITSQNQNIFGTTAISIGTSNSQVTTEVTERTEYTLDLSNVTGAYWLGFTMEGTSALNDPTFKRGGFRVTDVYFLR